MTTLEARDLAYVRGGQRILSGISVSVHPGECLAVTGPSGSGKTSLLALLAGLDTPSSGEVRIDGGRLVGVAGHDHGVALVLQGYGLVSLLTAAENVEVALRAAGCAAPLAGAAAREALGQVGLGTHADQLVEELSGGQQQRTAVARALALRPELLIADEPTAELDPVARALTLTRLFEVAANGGALVLATHDPEVAERCDRVLDLGQAGRPAAGLSDLRPG
jgi:putative ABC transport system ATP-binding protein